MGLTGVLTRVTKAEERGLPCRAVPASHLPPAHAHPDAEWRGLEPPGAGLWGLQGRPYLLPGPYPALASAPTCWELQGPAGSPEAAPSQGSQAGTVDHVLWPGDQGLRGGGTWGPTEAFGAESRSRVCWRNPTFPGRVLFPFLIKKRIDWRCRRRHQLHFNDSIPGLLVSSLTR